MNSNFKSVNTFWVEMLRILFFFLSLQKKISGLMQISLLNLVPEMQLANIYQRKRDMIRDRAVGSSEFWRGGEGNRGSRNIGLWKENVLLLYSLRGTIRIFLSNWQKKNCNWICHEKIKLVDFSIKVGNDRTKIQ